MTYRHGLSRPQFSLRAILAVTALAALYLAFAARQDAKRRQLMTDIENAGGTVEIGETVGFTLFQSERVNGVTLPYARLGQVNGAQLKAFPNLSTLSLLDVDVTMDDGIRIQCSEIEFTTITDEMLDQLGATISNTETR